MSMDGQMDSSGTVSGEKGYKNFVQDTISRIGELQNQVERTGMQMADAISRSLFVKTDKSGGNDV